MRVYKLSICLFLISFLQIRAQSTIEGTVKDAIDFLAGANVTLKNTKFGTETNLNGEFKINCPEGTYIMEVSFIGFKTITKNINTTKGESLNLNFILKEDNFQLDNITIKTKTKAEKLRETSYAVEVIESEIFKNLSVNANEILNKVSGVNIRQSGGFGEDAVLSLNGLSGSQVRIFIDGIPMEFFGSSLSLNNFPANLIEQIEVYKGVVPIHLSADALGGAVNITTNKSNNSFMDASYSFGSFNTHIASVNAQYRDKASGFTARLKSFYNYSDNNYTVDVNLFNANTGKTDTFTTEVEHFHDAYNSKMIWLEGGLTNTKFADELMFGIMYSDNYDEIQQYPNSIGIAATPFGEVTTTENKIISNFSFAKKGLLTENLNVKAYLVSVISEEFFEDIGNYKYNWFGERLFEVLTGEREIRKSQFTLNKENILGNLRTEYSFSKKSNLALNYSLNSLHLYGNDTYNEQNNASFSIPSTLNKSVLGISYTNAFFDGKLNGTSFIKHYKYHNSSQEADWGGTIITPISIKKEHLGFGLTATYFLNDFQIKASFENALRFPDVLELYGDGTDFGPNHNLLPEKSNNYNLGFIYDTNYNKNNFTASINGFIRDSKDFIRFRLEGVKLVHFNDGDYFTKGIDFSSNFNYKSKFNISLAATYTNKVDNNKVRGDDDNSTYGLRFPNEPYLYGNISASYIFKNILKEKDSFSFTLNENYVHEFSYQYENLGFDQDLVPSQLTTDIELVYSTHKQKYNFSFGVINLFDADTFDNLNQQNPGRSYNFKLRYFLN